MPTCTVCLVQLNKLNDLASRMENDHKNKINRSHDINNGHVIKCNGCDCNFKTKIDLTTHIKEKHKSYTPCDYFYKNLM